MSDSESGSYGPYPSNDVLAIPRDRPPLRKYYMVALALARGSERDRRPRLPEELVILICRFANFHCPSAEYTFEADQAVTVRADGSSVASKIWMQSPPLTTRTLGKIHSIQLFTDSRHQGWVSDRSAGSWSWFDIGICRLDEGSGKLNPKTKPDGLQALWTSHAHPVDRQEDMRNYELHTGKRFGPKHPIWDYADEGDVLVVEATAQFPGWANYARRGVMKVKVWWQPSAAMLNLILNT
ncbi:hypothetical protein FRC08_003788 [Ceratobasidium sp. 394]|nr:hypothetical protein FRC08_003788 [Ceratobasidium sp. 394]